jgi:hypothetical protein
MLQLGPKATKLWNDVRCRAKGSRSVGFADLVLASGNL